MKKTLYSLLCIFTLLFAGCKEDLPVAGVGLYELKSLTVTPGDMAASLTWENYEEAFPNEYLIIWTAGSGDVEGGTLTVPAGELSAEIDKLVNDVAYTFSVQPRYDGGLASKLSATCTPKNARYPVTDLTAAAGDSKVRLRWTKPATERMTKHEITVNPGNKVIEVTDVNAEEYIVDGLTNGQEYTFGIVTVYPTGNSVSVEAKATPGELSPILANNELVLWEACAFTYNDMYFLSGEVKSVHWEFGDGYDSDEIAPTHAYGQIGTYTVSITVTYENDMTETASMQITVGSYKWNSIDLNFGGLTGYVKTSNPVFSPDGKTMYVPTSTPAGHLFAIDVVSGDFKWAFAISKITYGGGAVVGEDGTIYQCVSDASIDNVYAIQPNGVQKWALKLDGKVEAFPALSADGILYCVSNKSTLYAIEAATGSIKWEQTLEGTTGSAVVIGKNGNIYVGTSAAIYAFKPNKEQLWMLSGVNVTERAAFALDGNTLYATLKSKAGLVAVDMTTGTQKWAYATSGGDAYFPIVDTEGNIYFTEKGSQTVFAVSSSGNLLWSKKVGSNLNYSGGALSTDGILYIGVQKPHLGVLGLDTKNNGNIVFEESVNQQIMASVTIGPDKRLYTGTIGSDNVGALKAFNIGKTLETGSWSVRGGDLQGTNRQK